MTIKERNDWRISWKIFELLEFLQYLQWQNHAWNFYHKRNCVFVCLKEMKKLYCEGLYGKACDSQATKFCQNGDKFADSTGKREVSNITTNFVLHRFFYLVIHLLTRFAMAVVVPVKRFSKTMYSGIFPRAECLRF